MATDGLIVGVSVGLIVSYEGLIVGKFVGLVEGIIVGITKQLLSPDLSWKNPDGHALHVNCEVWFW